MTRFAPHIPVTLIALICFGLQCVLPLQAAPSRLCLHQLSPATHASRANNDLPACCAAKEAHQKQEELRASSCCDDHQNAAQPCDDCGCCISNPHAEQLPVPHVVSAPNLEFNSLEVAVVSASADGWGTIALDEIRPRDPPTQSALCVWLK
ncbi:MAG: hypothetical protein CMJ46_13525 [Planctomyces sp.]|nr:hypothetical protein [Planctomyces sp.]